MAGSLLRKENDADDGLRIVSSNEVEDDFALLLFKAV